MVRPLLPMPVTGARKRVPMRASGYVGGETKGSSGGKEVSETSGDAREGLKMPNFELPGHDLLPFDLYQTLKERPLVLVFYRGDW